MAQPVLVTAYAEPGDLCRSSTSKAPTVHALPSISSYAFADILRTADSLDFQSAINGIAEICAKNRLSLADEHESHLPPLGVIDATTPAAMRPHLQRPGMRRALTSVPEASSGSSEGSRKSKKQAGKQPISVFSFARRRPVASKAAAADKPPRKIRIGSMGRTLVVESTTALAIEAWNDAMRPDEVNEEASTSQNEDTSQAQALRRMPSAATLSLQRLLSADYGLRPD